MFPVKVKVEKSESPRGSQSISSKVLPGSEHWARAPTSWKRRVNTSLELEMAKARNQLDAVLQCLLEKSHMDRERLDEEAGKTPSDTHSKDCSIAVTGKRGERRGGRWMMDWLKEGHNDPGSEVTNSKSCDVYKLPPPTAPGLPGDACRSRIPSPLQPEIHGTPDDEPSEPEPSPSTLIYRNMQRWKRIRQRWKEASHRNQLRYSESMKILREMYERQ
ncbi:protein lin-37 homolog isoform X5 [Phyllostomus discolor]|uniref:Protein lin-37 homolog isoform X5 n=1 Tax=Phyllostomus discolor TaxID=89673 RepID=A0A7E6CQH5_9CHIR|nr:protein lin-37 homolog isoform X5 [Phyllostomus discolor]